jgi:hypothetical protein
LTESAYQTPERAFESLILTRVTRESGYASNLGRIATALGWPLEGDPGGDIGGLAGLENARGGRLSFVTGPRGAL